MDNIYVPNLSGECYYIQDKDTIRVYDSIPQQNSQSTYTDYFVNSHYLEKTGIQTWGSNAVVPQCLNKNMFTDVPFYRNDIMEILVSYIIMVFISFYIPLWLFSRLFKKGGL